MKLGASMVLCALIGGCASVAVTSNTLEDRTALALGLNKGDFTIINRQDSGVRSDYTVQTKTGAQYSCYVTGAVSIVGRSVSDAICNQTVSVDKKAEKNTDKKAPTPNNATCNALLKAAGKC